MIKIIKKNWKIINNKSNNNLPLNINDLDLNQPLSKWLSNFIFWITNLSKLKILDDYWIINNRENELKDIIKEWFLNTQLNIEDYKRLKILYSYFDDLIIPSIEQINKKIEVRNIYLNEPLNKRLSKFVYWIIPFSYLWIINEKWLSNEQKVSILKIIKKWFLHSKIDKSEYERLKIIYSYFINLDIPKLSEINRRINSSLNIIYSNNYIPPSHITYNKNW